MRLGTGDVIRPSRVFICAAGRGIISDMSSEKKEGRSISGNLVVCDNQKDYSENLIRVLPEKISGDYQIHLFHNIEKLKSFSEKNEIGILLISEGYEREKRDDIPAQRKIILTERKNAFGSSDEEGLFRYQAADGIAEYISGCRGKGSPKTSGMPFREQRRKVPDLMARGLIGIYSPVHRIGKTRFALRLGRQLAEKIPVLYLNLEGYSGGDYYFPDRTGQSIEDLLCYMKQDKINPGIRISTMAGQYEGVDYLMPIRHERDLMTVRGTEWLELFDTIMDKCIYEAVILDLGEGIEGIYEILRKCDRVYTLYIEEEAALAKLEQYEENLREAGYSDVLNHTVKRRVTRGRQSSERRGCRE